MQKYKEVVGGNLPFVAVRRILLVSPFGLYYSQSIACGSMRSSVRAACSCAAAIPIHLFKAELLYG